MKPKQTIPLLFTTLFSQWTPHRCWRLALAVLMGCSLFGQVLLAVPAPVHAQLPFPPLWGWSEIGHPAPGSGASEQQGRWTVSEGDTVLSQAGDQLGLVSYPLSQDGSLLAHVTGQSALHEQ